ncbi:SDR family NAD(P)-dependent oxidoreductase [Nocardia sp. NPDC002869]|uniref:SDR family NAD(P)-dependent oxidoreductase n=1 Tax=Nocardia sp. NPDC002869 TaxID=3161032 RepID=UPI00398D4EC3
MSSPISTARAAEVAGGIVEAGGRAEGFGVDVADAAQVEVLAATAFERHGSVELLINDAGIESAGLLWEIDPQRWQRVMQINVDGVFHCVKSFVSRIGAASQHRSRGPRTRTTRIENRAAERRRDTATPLTVPARPGRRCAAHREPTRAGSRAGGRLGTHEYPSRYPNDP